MSRSTILRVVVALALIGWLAYRVVFRAMDSIIQDADVTSQPFRPTPNVVVLPHLRMPLPTDRSAVWCGTLQLAWDELEKFAPSDVLQPFLTQEPIGTLLLHDFKSTDIAEARYYAAAGSWSVSEQQRYEREILARFPNAKPRWPDFPPMDYAGVAYLQVLSRFHHPFEVRKQSLPFHYGDRIVQVKAFGIDEGSSGQVSVLAYEDRNSFVVGLNLDDKNLDLWLAKVQPGRDLRETITMVRTMVADAPEMLVPLIDGDFAVPRFQLDRSYAQSIPTIPPGGLPLLLFQEVRFRLNERGVELYSTAVVAAAETAMMPTEKREFLLDRPFLVLLTERDSRMPFCVAWIADPEVLDVVE